MASVRHGLHLGPREQPPNLRVVAGTEHQREGGQEGVTGGKWREKEGHRGQAGGEREPHESMCPVVFPVFRHPLPTPQTSPRQAEGLGQSGMPVPTTQPGLQQELRVSTPEEEGWPRVGFLSCGEVQDLVPVLIQGIQVQPPHEAPIHLHQVGEQELPYARALWGVPQLWGGGLCVRPGAATLCLPTTPRRGLRALPG